VTDARRVIEKGPEIFGIALRLFAARRVDKLPDRRWIDGNPQRQAER
jgi:hypothetical protein